MRSFSLCCRRILRQSSQKRTAKISFTVLFSCLDPKHRLVERSGPTHFLSALPNAGIALGKWRYSFPAPEKQKRHFK
jgi:hypothetical protein